MKARRSAGLLRINRVFHRAGHFTVEMTFRSASSVPGTDEAKSAALSARQHFYRLLFENGYLTHGEPQSFVAPNGPRELAIVLSCPASKKKTEAIKIYDQDEVVRPGRKKANEAGNKMD